MSQPTHLQMSMNAYCDMASLQTLCCFRSHRSPSDSCISNRPMTSVTPPIVGRCLCGHRCANYAHVVNSGCCGSSYPEDGRACAQQLAMQVHEPLLGCASFKKGTVLHKQTHTVVCKPKQSIRPIIPNGSSRTVVYTTSPYVMSRLHPQGLMFNVMTPGPTHQGRHFNIGKFTHVSTAAVASSGAVAWGVTSPELFRSRANQNQDACSPASLPRIMLWMVAVWVPAGLGLQVAFDWCGHSQQSHGRHQCFYFQMF